MMRCPQCGRRVPDAAPVCRSHGAVPPPAAVSGVRALPQANDALAARGYRVTGLLGSGGFGAVYAAERVSDRAHVAIKLTVHDTESLQREEAALRTVGPPHVPSVFDAGALADAYFVVMERIVAPTLADRMLELAGPAPLDAFSVLARALLAPVEAVHARGFLHCDLKPENIFVLPTGDARLIDFGLARRIEAREQLVPADDVGTAEYMSPEQCERLLCDRSADIYSLGILFYELLSGAPPFWGPAADVREAHRSQRPAPLSRKVACPAELDGLIRRCLAKDRSRRFDDIAGLRSALEHALSASIPPWRRSRKPRQPGTRSEPSQPNVLQLTAASPPQEKRAVGLVFFESRVGLGRVHTHVAASGGQIVHTQDVCFVAAFGHDAGANPARVAFHAAQRLLAAEVTARLVVDVATVSVRVRADGTHHIFSALLTKTDRYPTAADPSGVLFTHAASEVLPDLELRRVRTGADRYALAAADSGSDALPPLVGREDILEQLRSSAQYTAEAADPTLIAVVSPPGYGRTHLAAVAAAELRRGDAEVIELSAQEGAMSQVLPKLLRRVLVLPDAPPDDPRALLFERLGEAGETTWAGVAHALGWIEAEHPEVQRLAAAPGTLRLIAARTAGDALRRMAADKLVALLLDDAHLADEATLDALQYATLKDTPARVWVCVFAPPSFASIRPSWYSSAAAAQHIVLPALAPAAAVKLAQRLLLPAEYTSEAVLRKLAERTQGVPRLLVELVRGLKRDGFVRKSERGTRHYLATDELDKLSDLPILQWNAMREIEALPQQLAGHARLASVLGSSFSVSEIDALEAQLERDDLLDIQLDPSVGVQRLVESGVLVRHGSGLIDFRHALLRDMIYRLVPEVQRARIHRAAFEAYRTLPMPENQRLPRIALHAARCGEREVAAATFLELAERSVRAQAYADADAAYGGALDNLKEGDPRMLTAARGRGLMRSRLGRQEEALVDLRKARELAQLHGAAAAELEIMLEEATVLDWLRESHAAIALVRAVEASGATMSNMSTKLRAQLAMSLARSHFRQGEVEATIRVGNEAVQLTAALGDEGYETRVVAQLMLAPGYAILGRLEEAQRCFEELIADAESRGDLRHVSAALGNRALLWHGLQDAERLFADLARATQLGRELGEAPLEYVSVYNLAETEYLLGKLAEAREHAERMLQLARQQFGENNREVSISELLLARIALYDDDVAAAHALTANIRERMERGRALGDAEAELESSAQLLLETVELSASAAPLSSWQALLERARSVELQPSEIVELLEGAALALARLGEWPTGKRIYGEALEVLQAKPSLIAERVTRRLAPIFADVP